MLTSTKMPITNKSECLGESEVLLSDAIEKSCSKFWEKKERKLLLHFLLVKKKLAKKSNLISQFIVSFSNIRKIDGSWVSC